LLQHDWFSGNGWGFDPVISGTAIVTVEGTLAKWQPLTLSFVGPTASERDDFPNPFLDYRLQVTMTSPSGSSYLLPGFFAGDGHGKGTGNLWQVRFSPDELGDWSYLASFRGGIDAAVTNNINAGIPSSFHGATGQFTITDRNPNAAGFLKWGRLEYVGAHYLKFRDGPYWIKGGTNSPENFLGYAGFDDTVDQGGLVPGFTHLYENHVADWRNGHPQFSSNLTGYDAKGIVGALNYLSQQHVNSIYFLPMNLGGDGQETYPFVGTSGNKFDNTHYDISKLHQWNAVLNHAQNAGIALHIVLNETEEANRFWLSNGELGTERRLFYRELIARFGYLLAIKWNISEENIFPLSSVANFINYIQALDWANHPITFHNRPNSLDEYSVFLNDPRFTITSIQYRLEATNNLVEQYRTLSTANGVPWVVDMDENGAPGSGVTPYNATDFRKRVLYAIYFSGGNLEWYAGYHALPDGGDMRLEDFHTREEMWAYTWASRSFLEQNVPFWEMEPADDRLTDEAPDYDGGQVFAKPDSLYAVYLPNAKLSGKLFIGNGKSCATIRWYNPRTGIFEGATSTLIANNGTIFLGYPPVATELAEDWVILVTVCP